MAACPESEKIKYAGIGASVYFTSIMAGLSAYFAFQLIFQNDIAWIIESIKKIIAIEDKFSWFESMRPILEHNYENLKKNSTEINPAFVTVERTYKKYFKLGKYKDESRYSS
jgi:hypothetical protein